MLRAETARRACPRPSGGVRGGQAGDLRRRRRRQEEGLAELPSERRTDLPMLLRGRRPLQPPRKHHKDSCARHSQR